LQYIGFILLLASAWLGYCGVESFNPLALLVAIAKAPATAATIIAKEQAFKQGNTFDVFAADSNPTPTTSDASANDVDSAPSDAINLGSFEKANASVLNSQGDTAADVKVYQQYASALLQSLNGQKSFGGTTFANGETYHYTATDVQDLVNLWNKESGWNPTADNPSSDAFGIPQALPATKLPDGKGTSAAGEINWGIEYILGRYGSPTNAWAHETANNWY